MQGKGRGPTARFGPFEFDCGSGELRRGPHLVRLAPKPAEVLTLLVRAGGQLVTREELKQGVWGDVPIDLSRSLNFAIRQVRDALDDRADRPVFVETLPKRGYRFMAPVTWLDGAPTDTATVTGATATPAPASTGSARRARTPLIRAALVATLGLLSVTTGLAWTRRGADTEQATLAVLPLTDRRPAAPGSDAPGPAASLIDDVPFVVTDELITRLARLDPTRLSVIAPTSARAAQERFGSTDEVAGALGADYLLHGAVTTEDDAIRVSLRLIEAEGGTVLWSDRYLDRAPASGGLEYEIASRVADVLRDRLALGADGDVGTPSPTGAARATYLRGLYLLDQSPSRAPEAVAELSLAVAARPDHAPFRVALARALVRSGQRGESRVHLARALELDPSSSEAHIGLGVDALYARWDMDAARTHFERARDLDPGNVLAHHPYAYFLSIEGRHAAAIHEIETALRLDPVSPLVNGDVGRIYYRAGRFDEAKVHCARTLELDPEHAAALSCLLNIHLLQGDPAGAVPFATASLAASSWSGIPADTLATLEPTEAIRVYLEDRARTLKDGIAAGRDLWVPLAQVQLFLGRTDDALTSLERALEVRSTTLPQVPGDPCFAVLVGLPRYDAVVAALGLSRSG